MPFNFFTRKKQPQKLPFTTDIHCHVVPGVDDGSPDIPTSLELIGNMYDWGIQRIFASPHSTQDTFENTPQSLAEPFAKLKNALEGSGMDIKLLHHAEYRLDEFFIRQMEANNLMSLPGNHLLVENSFSQEPWNIRNLLFDLRVKGYTPILAHPERYQYYSRHHRNRYDELSQDGLLFQINLLSLAGHYGKLEREIAIYLLKQGMVQFIGTDIHRQSHIDSIRAYLTSGLYKKDIKLFGNILNDSL